MNHNFRDIVYTHSYTDAPYHMKLWVFVDVCFECLNVLWTWTIVNSSFVKLSFHVISSTFTASNTLTDQFNMVKWMLVIYCLWYLSKKVPSSEAESISILLRDCLFVFSIINYRIFCNIWIFISFLTTQDYARTVNYIKIIPKL